MWFFFWNVFIILLCLAAFILLRNLSKFNRLYDMWVCGYIWGCSAVCAFQLIRTIDAWRFICKSFRLIGLTYKWLTFYRIVIENNKREWYENFCMRTRNFSYPHYITRSCGYAYGYESIYLYVNSIIILCWCRNIFDWKAQTWTRYYSHCVILWWISMVATLFFD